ncbi:hypothetical protein ACO0LV_05285 [Pseudactinotalea sp. Z1739]|uniref:hypothetical protein n=1 Tax=Pseudactinotalea sp. Z1739 TaxID=3413028 RepID=UPI003C7B94FB
MDHSSRWTPAGFTPERSGLWTAHAKMLPDDLGGYEGVDAGWLWAPTWTARLERPATAAVWHTREMVNDGAVQYRLVATHPKEPTYAWAAWRVVDAGERLNRLEQLFDEGAERWQAHVHVRVHRDDPTESPRLDFPEVVDELGELGRRVTVLASEVIHHSRAALDYCAHNAAWVDSGVRNLETQFPFESTPEKWNRRRKSPWLRGVSDEHVAWIDAVQPYRGVEWSKNLQRLSNHDKHRVSIHVLPAYRVTLDPHRREPDPLGEPEYEGLEVTDRVIELLIGDAFADEEEDLVEASATLWQIVKGVAGVVNRFLESEGSDPLTFEQAPRS